MPRGILVRSSDVLFKSKSVKWLHISLLYYNSDVVIMSRRNRKNFTYAFCKSGAFQLYLHTHICIYILNWCVRYIVNGTYELIVC